MSKIRVAVVGVGHHGRHHARLLAASPDAELVAVVDRHEPTARSVAEQHGAAALADVRDLPPNLDAVMIAVPTSVHFAVAAPFLRRGVATFIEKPLATDLEQARELVRLAEAHRAVLQVGHVERYNPAWLAFESHNVRPHLVSAQRFSRYPFRCLDVSVVSDVMIHDLELILSAVGSPVSSVDAVGDAVVSPTIDRAEAWIRFSNGASAHIAANRIHHEGVRRMRLDAADGSWEIDFGKRTTASFAPAPAAKSGEACKIAPDVVRDQRDALYAKFFAVDVQQYDQKVEPLKLELEDFLRCVRTGATAKVSGQAGYAAVVLAGRIHEAIADNRGGTLRRSA